MNYTNYGWIKTEEGCLLNAEYIQEFYIEEGADNYLVVAES